MARCAIDPDCGRRSCGFVHEPTTAIHLALGTPEDDFGDGSFRSFGQVVVKGLHKL
jgi:hypothetical protein